MSVINETVDFVNYHYYSKPLELVNLNAVQIPFPLSLKKVLCQTSPANPTNSVNDGHYEFHLRLSHGLPHALAAMELFDAVHRQYQTHVLGYLDAMGAIARRFNISLEHLQELIQIAILFHDSARKGDGMDLWDEQSGDACEDYLKTIYRHKNLINEELIALISDAIRFKDNALEFMSRHLAYHPKIDFIRQLVNMADNLEVLRTRNVFKPKFMAIAAYVRPEVMVTQIIPELVVPHRQKIIEQGRLSKAGKIEYYEGQWSYDDSQYRPKSGYNDERIANAYIAKLQQYDCAVLEVDENNIDEVLRRALRGIKSYIDEYKNKSGIQLFHDGFFRPRYHGQLGLKRARFYERVLESDDLDIQDKTLALYALMAGNNGGSSLREAVSKSMHQMNRALFNTQLVSHLTVNAPWDDLAPRFKHYEQCANGLSKDKPLTAMALG